MRIDYEDYFVEFQIIEDKTIDKYMINVVKGYASRNTSSMCTLFLDKVQMIQLSKFIEMSVNLNNVEGVNYGNH